MHCDSRASNECIVTLTFGPVHLECRGEVSCRHDHKDEHQPRHGGSQAAARRTATHGQHHAPATSKVKALVENSISFSKITRRIFM